MSVEERENGLKTQCARMTRATKHSAGERLPAAYSHTHTQTEAAVKRRYANRRIWVADSGLSPSCPLPLPCAVASER